MTDVFTDIIQKLEYVRDNQIDFVKKSVEINSEVLAEINQQQLSEGLKSDGTFLPDYSPTSVSVYGKPPGPIKLFDTGDLYKGLATDLMENAFDMFSSDPKADMLSDRYDDSQGQIFGIIPENLDIFARQEFLDTLIKENAEFLLS